MSADAAAVFRARWGRNKSKVKPVQSAAASRRYIVKQADGTASPRTGNDAGNGTDEMAAELKMRLAAVNSKVDDLMDDYDAFRRRRLYDAMDAAEAAGERNPDKLAELEKVIADTKPELQSGAIRGIMDDFQRVADDREFLLSHVYKWISKHEDDDDRSIDGDREHELEEGIAAPETFTVDFMGFERARQAKREELKTLHDQELQMLERRLLKMVTDTPGPTGGAAPAPNLEALEELKEEFRAAKRSAQETELRMLDMKMQFETKEKELEMRGRELDSLRMQLLQRDKELEQKDQKLEEARQRVESLKDKARDYSLARDTEERAKKEMTDRLERAIATANRTEADLLAARKRAEESEGREDRLRKELEEAQAAAEKAAKFAGEQQQALLEQLQGKDKQLRQAKRTLDELSSENKDAAERAARAEEAARAAPPACDHEEEIGAMRALLQQLQARLKAAKREAREASVAAERAFRSSRTSSPVQPQSMSQTPPRGPSPVSELSPKLDSKLEARLESMLGPSARISSMALSAASGRIDSSAAIASLRSEIEEAQHATDRFEAAAADSDLEATRAELRAALQREKAAQRAAAESARQSGELRARAEALAAERDALQGELQEKEAGAGELRGRLEAAQAELAKVAELQAAIGEREGTIGELRALVQQLRESSAADQKRIEELIAAGARIQAEVREQAVEIRAAPKEEALPKMERFLKRMEETSKVTAERWEAKKGVILAETRRRLEALLVVVDKEQDRARAINEIASLIDTQAGKTKVSATGRSVFIPKLQTVVANALAEAYRASQERAQTERPMASTAPKPPLRDRIAWSPPERRPITAAVPAAMRRAVMELDAGGPPRTAPPYALAQAAHALALPPARGAFEGAPAAPAPTAFARGPRPHAPPGGFGSSLAAMNGASNIRRRMSGSSESGGEGAHGPGRPAAVPEADTLFRRPNSTRPRPRGSSREAAAGRSQDSGSSPLRRAAMGVTAASTLRQYPTDDPPSHRSSLASARRPPPRPSHVPVFHLS